VHLLRETEQAVGFARHGGDDDGHLVALALRGQATTRDILDALDCADRSAAEFLYDDHCEAELSPIREGEVNPAAGIC
jgi:hypothetical protein